MASPGYNPYRSLPDFLGVRPGEVVLLASDITRLAVAAIRNEGGFSPDNLIGSFLEALGPEGTLAIPAFNFTLGNNNLFDLNNSIPITGALAEAALKRKDFSRTANALHSFLVAGQDAAMLAAMQNRSSFGKDSPFAYFRDKDALMLMIGTSVTEAFTFVHHAEELEQVKYRRSRTINLHYIDGNGQRAPRTFELYSKRPGWTMDLAPLEELFRAKGILKEEMFNGVRCSIVRLGEAFPLIVEDIRKNGARRISRFSPQLFLKEKVKGALSSLHLYRTLTDKISHAPGPR